MVLNRVFRENFILFGRISKKNLKIYRKKIKELEDEHKILHNGFFTSYIWPSKLRKVFSHLAHVAIFLTSYQKTQISSFFKSVTR